MHRLVGVLNVDLSVVNGSPFKVTMDGTILLSSSPTTAAMAAQAVAQVFWLQGFNSVVAIDDYSNGRYTIIVESTNPAHANKSIDIKFNNAVISENEITYFAPHQYPDDTVDMNTQPPGVVS